MYLNGFFITALLGVIIIAISLEQVSAQSCQSQFTTVKSCYDRLLAKEDQANAAELRDLEGRKKALRNAANKCLREKSCSNEPTDPKFTAAKECLEGGKSILLKQMARCMSSKGDSNFNPQIRDYVSRVAPGADDRVDVRAAAHACQEQKKQKGLARDVQSCVTKETERTRRPGPAGQTSALKTFTEFNDHCKATKACTDSLTSKCSTDICACYNQVMGAPQMASGFKKCYTSNLRSAGADEDDAANADDILLRESREWFPFCTPRGEDEACDPENGVVPDVIDQLKGGDGANNALLDLAKSGFANGNLDIAKLFSGGGGNLLGSLTKSFGGKRK